jgi:uncharacterized membrane protein YphA (DoxX/SURF4 family)
MGLNWVLLGTRTVGVCLIMGSWLRIACGRLAILCIGRIFWGMTGVSNLWTWVCTSKFGLYDIFHTSALLVLPFWRDLE